MFPDNDLLDDSLRSRDFFENVLNHIGRVASRCCYFNISSNFLLFLKVNFCNDVNEFEKLFEDSSFILFKGFDRGPSQGEIERQEKQSPIQTPNLSDMIS